MAKIAVVLFNLGGPDKLENVRSFLYNLFSDPLILRISAPFRQILAWYIAKKREKTAQNIYKEIGGKSPIVENTVAQAAKLAELLGDGYKIHVAMRYWHPMFDQVMQEIKRDNPEKIILLPLYPQFSTTTTGSAYKLWDKLAEKLKINVPTIKLCCYPIEDKFIKASSDEIIKNIETVKNKENIRVLFSAHGLPKKIVDQGDPYCWQINQSANKIIEYLQAKTKISFETIVCYQSRVGPLEWTRPNTEEEIIKAGKEKKSLIIFPISFVSEHAETLVELDIEYKKIAEKAGVLEYLRVQTVADDIDYISGLHDLVLALEKQDKNIYSQKHSRICPKNFKDCPNDKI